MAGKLSKFLSYIGIVENDDLDEEVDYESEDDNTYGRARDNDVDDGSGMVYNRNKRSVDVEENFPQERPSKKESKPRPTVPPTVPSGNMKMIVYNPQGYEDTQNIIDCLKSGRPVVVNISEVDSTSAMRILDFLAGAVYALDGTMCKVANGIFIASPKGCDVVGNQEDENAEYPDENEVME